MAGFAAGLGEAQAAFGCHLAGGDTDRRPGPLSITIMVMGGVPRGRMVLRGAAKAGDRLYVSGTLGDAALGLALRLDPARGPAGGLDEAACAELVDRYVRPRPRLALAASLRTHASAAMDLSDGLLKDLGRMMKASGTGARIAFTALPLSLPARKLFETGVCVASDIVASGDDYEILATVPPDKAVQFETAALAAGVAVTAIGEVTKGPGIDVVDAGGARMAFDRSGWDHF
jgi:thiamine-monophosphate kinase